MPVWFEGGQMPLQRRLPKFGFTNNFRTSYRPVNISRIQQLVDEERIDAGEPITPDVLIGAGLAGKSDLIKILGGGEIEAKVEVSAHAFSNSAREKIEEAGGTTSVVERA